MLDLSHRRQASPDLLPRGGDVAGRGLSSHGSRPALSLHDRLNLARVHRNGFAGLIASCSFFAPYFAGAGVPWLGQVYAGLLLIAVPFFVEATFREGRLERRKKHLDTTIDEFMSRWRLAPEQEKAAA